MIAGRLPARDLEINFRLGKIAPSQAFLDQRDPPRFRIAQGKAAAPERYVQTGQMLVDGEGRPR